VDGRAQVDCGQRLALLGDLEGLVGGLLGKIICREGARARARGGWPLVSWLEPEGEEWVTDRSWQGGQAAVGWQVVAANLGEGC